MLDFYNEHYLFGSRLHRCCTSTCGCCLRKPDRKYLYDDVTTLRVKAMDVPDPDEINWESVNITRRGKFFRVVLVVFVIVVFLALTTFLMAICSVFITSNTANCMKYIDLTYNQAVNGDDTAKKCYCANNIVLIFNDNIKSLCLAIFQQIYLYNGLQILSALISTLGNVLFALLVEKLVEFTKPASITSAHISRTVVLFIFLFLNTCIVPVLIFSDINGVQIAKHLSSLNFNTQDIPFYSDFTPDWYRTVSPYFTNFLIIDVLVVWFKYVWQVCSACCLLSQAKKKEGKTIQRRLNMQFTNYRIDVTNYLAEELLIVFIGIMYCGGIPILLPLCMASLISRYITAKSLMLRYSSRVDGLTEELNEVGYILLPLASLFGCLVGLWMLTANSMIYPGTMSVSLPLPASLESAYSNLIVRSFYLSYTFVLACLILVYVLLYNTLVRFVRWLISLCYCSHSAPTAAARETPFSETVTFLNVLYTYDIHQNDKYKNAVHNMEKYLKQHRVHRQ